MPKSAGPTRNFDGRIVLLCAVNIVWKIIVERDPIKLRGRLVLFRPIFPPSFVTFAPPSLPSTIR